MNKKFENGVKTTNLTLLILKLWLMVFEDNKLKPTIHYKGPLFMHLLIVSKFCKYTCLIRLFASSDMFCLGSINGPFLMFSNNWSRLLL